MYPHLTALEQMLATRTSTTNNRTTPAAANSAQAAAVPQQPSSSRRLQPPVDAAAPPAQPHHNPVFQVFDSLGLPQDLTWVIFPKEFPVYMPGEGTVKCSLGTPMAPTNMQRPRQMMPPPAYQQHQGQMSQGQTHQIHVAPQPQRAEELLREASRHLAQPIHRVPVSQAPAHLAEAGHPYVQAPQPHVTVPLQPQQTRQRSPNLADVMRQLMAPSPAPQQMQHPAEQYQPQQRTQIPQQKSPTLQGVCPNILAGSAKRKRNRPQRDNTQAAKRPMPPFPVADLPPLKENYTSRSQHA